jgi:mono/diheme cytochrome c family protein
LTEIPEHLLQRSRERRKALGLLSEGGEGGEAPAPATPAPAEPAAVGPARPSPGAEIEPAARPGPVAVAEEQPTVTYQPPPRGPHKTRVPVWVMPVLVALPLWAFLYPGAFGNHKKTAVVDPLVVGQQVYGSSGCSGCHGAAGEGGVGPALHGGQSKLTFPNVADQINWVKNGSQSLTQGTPYGDPGRSGGQRVVKEASGDMPGFGSTLSPAQIQDVVQYEREKL